ncbi:hypothetical protein ACYOEI_12575 [Singulisphaera rosea]
MGTLLNILSRKDTEVFSIDEVLEVAYDQPMDPELFTYHPAPGEPVEPKPPIVEHLPLAAAVARMPFTVLVPTRVPGFESSHVEVMYHPPRRQGGWSYLAMMYRSSGAFQHLWVNQGAQPYPGLDNFVWEAIAVEGTALKDLRISDSGKSPGMRMIVFQQQGTHVQIRSDLERAQLIDMATSFSPAVETTTL